MRIQTRAPSTITSYVCVVILSESHQNLFTCLPFEVLATNSYQIPNVRPLDRKPRHTFFLHALIKPRDWAQRDRPPSSPWIAEAVAAESQSTKRVKDEGGGRPDCRILHRRQFCHQHKAHKIIATRHHRR